MVNIIFLKIPIFIIIYIGHPYLYIIINNISILILPIFLTFFYILRTDLGLIFSGIKLTWAIKVFVSSSFLFRKYLSTYKEQKINLH